MSFKVKNCFDDPKAIEDFRRCIQSSKTILALLGAGLSAPSGLSTFRGAGGLWRRYSATDLATPEAFDADPGLVWTFYTYRRHMAMSAAPNPGHHALANLARQRPEYMALSQNVDGLLERAKHPEKQLKLLHGSLFRIKCAGFTCDYMEDNHERSFISALSQPKENPQAKVDTYQVQHEGCFDDDRKTFEVQTIFDLSDERNPLTELKVEDIPKCPKCKINFLRPGVVWFGEALPEDILNDVDRTIKNSMKIDLILVVGTSALVYPAASYVDKAKAKGARVAVINTAADLPSSGLSDHDWFFKGDASIILPTLLKDLAF